MDTTRYCRNGCYVWHGAVYADQTANPPDTCPVCGTKGSMFRKIE